VRKYTCGCCGRENVVPDTEEFMANCEAISEINKKRPDVSHYTGTKIQPIDIIEDWYPVWLEDTWYAGNAVKYLRRFRLKGTPLQDLRKARDYIDFLIEKYDADL
jgi:hypothetical protein